MRNATVLILPISVIARAIHARAQVAEVTSSASHLDPLADKLTARVQDATSNFFGRLVDGLLKRRPQTVEPSSHHRARERAFALDNVTSGKAGLSSRASELRGPLLGRRAFHGDLRARGRLHRPPTAHQPTSQRDEGLLARGRKRPDVSVYAVMPHDIETLAALPFKGDEINAALSQISELPKAWFDWYDTQALEFPLRTKAMTSGFCYSMGDLCAQGLAGKNITSIDFGRTARSGTAGFVGHGPVAHHWINFLERYLSFGGAWWAVFPKVIANQPMNIVYNFIYSFVIGTLAFRPTNEIWRDVKAAAWPGFIASVKFWPFVNLVTFGVIPLELRVAWVDSVKIVWICILSRINNEKIRGEASQAAAAAAGKK